MEKQIVISLLVVGFCASFSLGYDVQPFEVAPYFGPVSAWPDVDGYRMAWVGYTDDSQTSSRIYVYDFLEDELIEVPSIPYMPSMSGARISGSRVAWIDCNEPACTNSRIRVYDVETEQLYDLGQFYMPSNESPNIDGDYVVWFDCNDQNCLDYVLRYYDLSDESEHVVAQHFSAPMYQPKIGDDYIVWQDFNSPAMTETYIYGYDIDDGVITEIARSYTAPMGHPNIDGNTVVWYDYNDQNMIDQYIFAYNTETQTMDIVSRSYSMMSSPSVSGDYVAWWDNNPITAMPEIYAYSLLNETKQVVSGLSSAPLSQGVSLDGEFVVWADMNMPSGSVIYGYDLEAQEKFVIGYNYSPPGMYQPDIDNGILAWIDWADMQQIQQFVYAARIFNDSCIDGYELLDNVTYSDNTIGATGQIQSSCAFNDVYDVWYRYHAGEPGSITISTDGSDFDTTLSVFNGCGGDELVCNDDYSIYNTQSRVSMDVVKSKDYYVRVSGFDGQRGSYQLEVARGECSAPLKGDLNLDCKVDFADLAELVNEWLDCNLEPVSLCW